MLLKTLETLAEIGIRRDFHELRIQRLDYARKKTTQKVNLFEKVQIPGYQDAILKIKRYLIFFLASVWQRRVMLMSVRLSLKKFFRQKKPWQSMRKKIPNLVIKVGFPNVLIALFLMNKIPLGSITLKGVYSFISSQ